MTSIQTMLAPTIVAVELPAYSHGRAYVRAASAHAWAMGTIREGYSLPDEERPRSLDAVEIRYRRYAECDSCGRRFRHGWQLFEDYGRHTYFCSRCTTVQRYEDVIKEGAQ